MSTEKQQVSYRYDREKDVLVPFDVYAKLENLVRVVENEGKTNKVLDKFAYFEKNTHKKLSEKNRKKMSDKDLEARYYYNYDFEAMKKSVSAERTELSAAALELIGELVGVFRHNIEKGNCIEEQPKEEEVEADS